MPQLLSEVGFIGFKTSSASLYKYGDATNVRTPVGWTRTNEARNRGQNES
jgi:hypothetical protein